MIWEFVQEYENFNLYRHIKCGFCECFWKGIDPNK